MCIYSNFNLALKRNQPQESISEDIYNTNKKLNRLETLERKIVLTSKPTAIMAILNTICNLRCIMCTRVRNEQEILPFELIKKAYALFPYLGLIDWQGGEVFLMDYFKELFLGVARYPNILQQITTNGLLINKEWAQILAESRVDLLYSIDSVSKDIYEAIRLGAKFEDLLERIDLVNSFRRKYGNRNRLEITAVVMKRNYKTLHLFPAFCKEYNFASLHFELLMPEVVPDEDIVSGPDLEAILYLDEIIPQIESECKAHNIYFKCAFDAYIKRIAKNFRDNRLNKNTHSNIGLEYGVFKTDCMYPWKRLHIETNGWAYPACQCKVSIGDLKNDTLEDIWNGDAIQLYRKLLSNNEAGKICSPQCHFSAAVGRTESIDVPE